MASPNPRWSPPRRYLADDVSRQRRVDEQRARERRDREARGRPARDALEEAFQAEESAEGD